MHNPISLDLGAVHVLFGRRWRVAVHRLLELLPGETRVEVQLGASDHFRSPRGYATTAVLGGGLFRITLAEKLLAERGAQSIDAILRHEIGHVIDFSVPAHRLDAWGRARGVHLPVTRERRADALAEAVWDEPIFYDGTGVQSLVPGTRPRPEIFGL